jgi:type III restriction enzyme
VDSYYQFRELVPPDMLPDMQGARVVISNFHAFKQREKTEISSAGRAPLNGRHGEKINTVEPEGQMLQRVVGGLTGNIIIESEFEAKMDAEFGAMLHLAVQERRSNNG